jgi:flagellar motor switch protein FliN/FliY
MSSSPSSSSSSDPTLAVGAPLTAGLDHLRDVKCPVTVVLGTGHISVRRVLTLRRQDVIKLHQSAGEDLQTLVNGVPVARGEVVVVEDRTAVRLTEIARRTSSGEK